MANSKQHTGKWIFHDDDCFCAIYNKYCNRNGWVWSCCGACKEDSECTGELMHPTYWNHPKFTKTIDRYDNNLGPVYKTNEEIRKIAPECFEK